MEFMEKQRNADVGLLSDTIDENGSAVGGRRRRKEEELLDIAYNASTGPAAVDEVAKMAKRKLASAKRVRGAQTTTTTALRCCGRRCPPGKV